MCIRWKDSIWCFHFSWLPAAVYIPRLMVSWSIVWSAWVNEGNFYAALPLLCFCRLEARRQGLFFLLELKAPNFKTPDYVFVIANSNNRDSRNCCVIFKKHTPLKILASTDQFKIVSAPIWKIQENSHRSSVENHRIIAF